MACRWPERGLWKQLAQRRGKRRCVGRKQSGTLSTGTDCQPGSFKSQQITSHPVCPRLIMIWDAPRRPNGTPPRLHVPIEIPATILINSIQHKLEKDASRGSRVNDAYDVRSVDINATVLGLVATPKRRRLRGNVHLSRGSCCVDTCVDGHPAHS